jgi:hypothetical protein
VIGASIVVDVPIQGRLMGPDLLCTVGLLYLLVTSGIPPMAKEAKLFFLMLGLWLFGAIVTDIIRETALEDLVRGWSKILFFGITYAFLYIATQGGFLRTLLFMLGLEVGMLASLLIAPEDSFFVEPWKFGYGPAITIFLLAFISTPLFRRVAGPWWQIGTTIAIAALNLAGNSRAIFGILLVVAGLLVLGELFRFFLGSKPIPKIIFAFTLLSSVIGYQGIVTIYETAVSSGMLGHEALEKFERQTENGSSLLLGGRAESLISSQAISDSPIIGHGSWAKDMEYVMLYVRILEERGEDIFGDPFKSALIPSHSYLLGAWVEAGFLGGLFWFYVLAICGRSIYSLFHIPLWSRPLVAFIILSLIWAVLFSPFGAQERFFVPVQICIVLWATRNGYSGQSPQRPMVGKAN